MNKKMIFIIAVIIAIGFGAGFVYEHLNYVSTDNANVQAHAVMLAPRVGGSVQKVLVEENQFVTKGQELVEIDSQDYQNTFDQVKGTTSSLKVKYKDASVNLERMRRLYKERAISPQQFDNAQAETGALQDQMTAGEAQLKQAQQNLEYTKLVAPSDGSIAKKAVEVGQIVPAGQPLIGFVSAEERWVTANFKETDLSDLKIGQKVKIEVDALPKHKFFGSIESISSSTGSTFTLLPPDNSTGNFTKVVQRVPVRIKFENLSKEDIQSLQAGLSAVVSVKIH
jgi:membrane fusion protein (multidrug efflux system)